MVDVPAAAHGKRGGYSDSHVEAQEESNGSASRSAAADATPWSSTLPAKFEDIYDRMGQLMNFAFGLTPAALADMPWVPLADLSETDDAYVVKAELPGVNKDQVNVQLQDRELVISGEIPEPESGHGKGDGARRHRSTRRAGQFQFRTYLPGDVNADAVTPQLPTAS